MGLETPIALLGLVAAALPVLAHLMRRRDLPLRELPTIALLERARARSHRRMRVIDLLLLATRILFIVTLAVAVAGPTVSVALAYGDGQAASIAVILDDSMSMSRRSAGRSLIAAAKARAAEVIGALPEGSEATVILAGDPARVLVPRTTDLAGASAQVSRVRENTARGTDMPGAVARALGELSGARRQDRRLLILSDLSRHGHWDDVRWPEGDLSVDVERLGPDPGPNRSVRSTHAVPDPTAPGEASIRVVLYSDEAQEELEVILRRGSDVLARGRVAIRRRTGTTTLHAPLVREGDSSALVTIVGEDALRSDDERAVLLRPSVSIRTLLVDGDPRPSRDLDEIGYVVRALDAAPRQQTPIGYRVVDVDSLESTELSSYDVVVLANTPAPRPTTADRLRAFVGGGGGLLVSVGDRTRPQRWEARVPELLPARLRAVAPADPPVAVSGAATAVGAGRGARLDLTGAAGLGGARVSRRALLGTPAPGAHAELVFEDGAPALVVGRYGEGRTAILATTLDDAWGDLPYRAGFLPLVVRLLQFLSPHTYSPDQPVKPGASVTITPPAGALHVEILTPDGRRVGRDSADPFDMIETDVAGAYRVTVTGGSGPAREDPRLAFVVAPEGSESDLSIARSPDLTSRQRTQGTRAAARRSLSAWFFLAAALLAVAEGLLRMKRRRIGRRAARAPGIG